MFRSSVQTPLSYLRLKRCDSSPSFTRSTRGRGSRRGGGPRRLSSRNQVHIGGDCLEAILQPRNRFLPPTSTEVVLPHRTLKEHLQRDKVGVQLLQRQLVAPIQIGIQLVDLPVQRRHLLGGGRSRRFRRWSPRCELLGGGLPGGRLGVVVLLHLVLLLGAAKGNAGHQVNCSCRGLLLLLFASSFLGDDQQRLLRLSFLLVELSVELVIAKLVVDSRFLGGGCPRFGRLRPRRRSWDREVAPVFVAVPFFFFFFLEDRFGLRPEDRPVEVPPVVVVVVFLVVPVVVVVVVPVFFSDPEPSSLSSSSSSSDSDSDGGGGRRFLRKRFLLSAGASHWCCLSWVKSSD
ncbi:hypothetical protein TYRP_012726 [Tyrophagus putrescentiae]|nr:hypothetical protein TYRP_012726 [Tyrophagus putrescentiae]